MALSKVSITVEPGNVGIPGSGAQNCVHVDVCTAGIPGQLYSFNSLSSVAPSLGVGSGAELVGFQLSSSGGPVLFVPVEPSVAGSVGSVTHTGTGVSTLTVSTAPCRQILLAFTATGGPGVGKYKVQLGSDGYGPVQTIPNAADGYIVRIPGTFTHLTFAGSGSFNSGDGYVFDTSGVTTGYGTSSSVTAASDPVDDFNVTVTVASGGTTGVAQAIVSLDGYGQVGGNFVLSSKVPLALPNNSTQTSGLVLSCSGTFVLNDTYSFLTCGPTGTNGDSEAAIVDLQTATPFSLLHFNNKHATSALAAAFASNVDSTCSSLFANYQFVRALMNTPSQGSVATSGGSLVQCTDSKSTIEASFSAMGSTRVGCGAYDAVLPSPISGLQLRRNFSWSAMGRLANLEPVLAASWVRLGGVTPAPVAISDNEFYDEGLSDAGFTVPTTIQGRSGTFVNQALTFSFKNASVYGYFEDARVMDLGCTIAYGVLVDFLNQAVLVDPKTGFIQEQAARQIEIEVNNALAGGLLRVTPQEASAAAISVDRTSDLLTNGGVLFATVTITPAAHLREISLTIGFGLQS
jgi:hypothetical protein